MPINFDAIRHNNGVKPYVKATTVLPKETKQAINFDAIRSNNGVKPFVKKELAPLSKPITKPLVKQSLTPLKTPITRTSQLKIDPAQQEANTQTLLSELKGKNKNIASFVQGAAIGSMVDPLGAHNFFKNGLQDPRVAEANAQNTFKTPVMSRAEASGMTPVVKKNLTSTYEGAGELAGGLVGVDPIGMAGAKLVKFGISKLAKKSGVAEHIIEQALKSNNPKVKEAVNNEMKLLSAPKFDTPTTATLTDARIKSSLANRTQPVVKIPSGEAIPLEGDVRSITRGKANPKTPIDPLNFKTQVKGERIYQGTGTKQDPFTHTDRVMGAEIPRESVTSKPLGAELPKPVIEKPIVKATSPTREQNNTLQNVLDTLYTRGVDSQNMLGKSTKGLTMSADKDIKTMGSNARNVRGTTEYVFQNNLVDMEGKALNKKSLEEILNTPEQDAFNDYQLHKHNIDRYRENKPIFLGDGENPTITDEMSRKIVADYERAYPHFAEKGVDMADFNGKIIDNWTVKSGLISKEFGEWLKKTYGNYVPTLREGGVKGEGFQPKGLKANSGIKQAVGGNKPIMAINKSYPIMVQKVMKAARQNELYNALLETVEKHPEKMRKWAAVVDDNAGKVANADLTKTTREAMEKDGIDAIDNLSNKMLEIDERNGKYFVTAMREGKPFRMEVHKDLFDAFKSLNKTGADGTLDEMAAIARKYATNPYKALITGYNPFFALRNISRDLPTSYIQGTENNPIKWFSNLVEAGKSMIKKDDAYNEFMALGGKKTGFFNNEKGLVPIGKTKKALRKVGEKIQSFNEFTETVPRYGEYIGTVKREGGDYAAKQKGIYNSGEVTVNFGRSGDVTKAVDSVVPYLNPAFQGIDKSIRALQKGSTWAKGVGAITVPTSILYAINNSTPEAAKNYEQLDNRTKDNYYVIPRGDGKYIKIPKSRESGVIFGSLFERLTRLATGKQDSFKDYGTTVKTNFAPMNPFESNIISPATLNLATNKDFANRSIVPLNMTKDGFGDARSKYLQADETTSEIAKWFGETAAKAGINNGEGFSPKVIDYLITSYTGIIGSVLTSSTTKGGNVIEKVLTKPFTADNLYNNNIQNDFYDRMNQLKKLKSDKNILEKIPSKTVTAEEQALKPYTKAAAAMSALRKQEKLLNQQPDSPQKETQLRAIRQKILDIAKNTN